MAIELTEEAKAYALANLPNGSSLIAYFEHHRPVGGFLRAVLSNKLLESYMAADTDNINALREYAFWLYNYAPGRGHGSWGSPEEVETWAPGSG